jgi:hypothetical protein
VSATDFSDVRSALDEVDSLIEHAAQVAARLEWVCSDSPYAVGSEIRCLARYISNADGEGSSFTWDSVLADTVEIRWIVDALGAGPPKPEHVRSNPVMGRAEQLLASWAENGTPGLVTEREREGVGDA